nr:MAG TPA: hypothetical protein [Caudoviricetes sp.]
MFLIFQIPYSIFWYALFLQRKPLTLRNAPPNPPIEFCLINLGESLGRRNLT